MFVRKKKFEELERKFEELDRKHELLEYVVINHKEKISGLRNTESFLLKDLNSKDERILNLEDPFKYEVEQDLENYRVYTDMERSYASKKVTIKRRYRDEYKSTRYDIYCHARDRMYESVVFLNPYTIITRKA